MKVSSETRSTFKVEQIPAKKVSVFSDESILEAYTIMAREKIDLVPVIYRAQPTNVVDIVTGESVSYAIEKAESLR